MKRIKKGVVFLGGAIMCLCALGFNRGVVSAAENELGSNQEWADEWSGDGEGLYGNSEEPDAEDNVFHAASFSVAASSSVNAVKVIVLDPGHDNVHAGARGNGFAEEERVLKIAQYCKVELEQYEGVKVYMTRESGDCPYPGTTSTQCNKKRVEYAKSVGADAYVSIHLNASTSSEPSGAEVYYPNTSYRSEIGTAGANLAKGVLNELAGLGLKNRGIYSRNSEDNSLYPDNSLADYYGVIKNSKLSGFPGIIIEHAFITSATDVSGYLNSDEKLQKLGVADATGIAKYYGLSKKNREQEYTEADLKLSATANANATQYTIAAAGISNCNSVQFAVWSMNNGQDDLKWYQAQKDSNGNWTVKANMSDFKTEGAYAVHTYITRSNGTQYFVGSMNFELNSDAAIERMVVSKIDREKGTFWVTVRGATAYSGIANLYIPVWTKADQSDIIWYKAEKNKEGNYEVMVDIKDHQSSYGTYQIHAYIESYNAIMKNVGISSVTLYQQSPEIKVTEQSTRGYFDLWADNIPYPDAQISMAFAVWSEENGQDDLQWYYSSPFKAGTWEKSIYMNGTATKGLYFVHAYVIQYDGTSELIGDTSFVLTEENAGPVTVIGDADLDGNVTLEDAKLVLRAALNIETLTGQAFDNADVNGDKMITLSDAQIILGMALGITE